MTQINELRVTPDKKYLIIDVQIPDMDYYENVYLDSIMINTQKTYDITNSMEPWKTIACDSSKHIRELVEIDGIADNLFFVTILTNGEAADDTPCSLNETYTLGVTCDKYPMYLKGMQFLKQLGNNCEPPNDFIDYILQNKAFELSLLTGNTQKAIDYWKLFFNEKEKSSVSSNCGCHGRYK